MEKFEVIVTVKYSKEIIIEAKNSYHVQNEVDKLKINPMELKDFVKDSFRIDGITRIKPNNHGN